MNNPSLLYIGLNLAYLYYLDQDRKNLQFTNVSKIILMTIVLVIQPICISMVRPFYLGMGIYGLFLYLSLPFTRKRERMVGGVEGKKVR